ncbi:unnamed protein product [Colletotrichum noveboracense]|uniref:Uncharacterized protein n=1 Tax=Colletotrichum noveboracense TaxID=2664923 RepID=A0A9W4RII3_9PEZI|nr:unnamed protein product [Colletotrichum noveboracense]
MDHGGNSAHHTNGCVDSSIHTNANTNVSGNADTNSSATSKTNAADDKTYSLSHGVSTAIERNMHNWCQEQLRQGNRVSRRQVLANIQSTCRTIDERLDVLKEQFDWEMMDLERAEAESLRRRLECRRSRHEGWMYT